MPAREVYQRALERGVPPERLRLLGHPVHPKFEDVSETKAEIRKGLGLPRISPIALLMAGGEGGGNCCRPRWRWQNRGFRSISWS